MVWNDFFDVVQDRRERPHRPIPSGRISRRAAGVLAILLSAAGLGFAGGCWPAVGPAPAALVGGILFFVLLYNGWLKRTPLGPLGMGACRFLNVLLGLSVAGWPTEPWMLHLAGVVGAYIAGVTWFARKEAAASDRRQLSAALGIMLLAAALGLAWPAWWAPDDSPSFTFFPYLLACWGVLTLAPAGSAIAHPDPKAVQAAVKRMILGLVGLDAVLAFVHVGWPALGLLALLAPAILLGRWVYST